MPIKHSPPARQARSWARGQAVLTPRQRTPLDRTPAVPQLMAQLDRGVIMQGEAPSRKIRLISRSSWHFSRNFKDHSQRSWKGLCRGGEEFCGRGSI
ncbi:hypothetical protein O181_001764 [Austropuccinia psidii MF-1]|uniref:Uncharacterized protein n=1 Tax=Austropuccinia psidii MF-1 TaxID=1389203 RepID=A0A9Q3BB64_9BASI|nr:hypothetical protein [Austropuccinia psidii MF-1]